MEICCLYWGRRPGYVSDAQTQLLFLTWQPKPSNHAHIEDQTLHTVKSQYSTNQTKLTDSENLTLSPVSN